MLVNTLHYLWNDEELKSLALTDASHSECSLGVVTECHVLANSDYSPGINALMNIHPGSVNLIVEREATVDGYTSLS